MIESDGESGIHSEAWGGGAEVQSVVGLIDIVEEVIHACFHIEVEWSLLTSFGTERIVACQSPYLIALAVTIELIISFGRCTSIDTCTPCALVLHRVVPSHIAISLVVSHAIDDHIL